MIEIYCINLTQHVERRQHMERQFRRHNLNVNWIQAIDGKQILKADKYVCCNNHPDRTPVFLNESREFVPMRIAGNFWLFNSNLTQGEVGCSLSMLLIYYNFLAHGNPENWILILEDDVDLASDFAYQLSVLQRDLPRLGSLGVELVYLNDRIGPNAERPDLNILEGRYQPVLKGHGFDGYLLSKSGIRKLLDIFNPLIYPVDLQSIAHLECYDSYPERRYAEANLLKPGLRLRAYKYYRNLVTHPHRFKSTIQAGCSHHKK